VAKWQDWHGWLSRGIRAEIPAGGARSKEAAWPAALECFCFFLVPGAWCLVPGARCPVPGASLIRLSSAPEART